MNFSRFLKRSAVVGLSITISLSAYGFLSGNEQFYASYAMPALHMLTDAEQAHKLAIKMAKYGFVPKARPFEDQLILKTRAFDCDFENPIGCAAGFDKGGEAMNGLFKIGFGFVEIGTITPLEQKGNPRPRNFRLIEDTAIINRYGLNSEGHNVVLERVKKFKDQLDYTKSKHQNKIILGINNGKNKDSTDAVNDYLEGLSVFGNYADYIVINITCPNTPGVRSLQNKNELKHLIDLLLEHRNRLKKKVPIVLKISPDLNEQQMQEMATVLNRKGKQIDGLIVSVSPLHRPSNLISKFKNESGGLSGRPLKDLSKMVLERMYELTNGKLTLIGVGGIENGQDALERIKSGASLIQIYTSMVYQGPVVVNRIRRELIDLLKKEGFSSVKDAIGFNLKKKNSNK